MKKRREQYENWHETDGGAVFISWQKLKAHFTVIRRSAATQHHTEAEAASRLKTDACADRQTDRKEDRSSGTNSGSDCGMEKWRQRRNWHPSMTLACILRWGICHTSDFHGREAAYSEVGRDAVNPSPGSYLLFAKDDIKNTIFVTRLSLIPSKKSEIWKISHESNFDGICAANHQRNLWKSHIFPSFRSLFCCKEPKWSNVTQ